MDCISDETRLTALIGSPVRQSLSPKIHNTAFAKMGLNYLYLSFDVKGHELTGTVEAMKKLNFRGFNVTMPHKQEIIEDLDDISQEAKLIGAVNTVVNEGGRLIGYNTDGRGYSQSLRAEGVSIKDKSFAIAGAGGAARSIAIQLALEGAKEIILLNRTMESGQRLGQIISNSIANVKVKVKPLQEEYIRLAINRADVLINSTPLGMEGMKDRSIIDGIDLLDPNLVVSDLIYNPSETKLLKEARAKGCKSLNGLGMLLGQAAIAFELWTGQSMPVGHIRETIKSSGGI